MSENRELEAFLDQAGQREKEYDWIAAAGFYESSLNVALGFDQLPKAGELYEKIGSCYRRAATQADNTGSFTECMTSAIEAYGNATGLYKEIKGKEVKAYRCSALAYYSKYWLAPTSIEKKELLDKHHELKTRVFYLYKKAHDWVELGKAYNELMMCLCESDSDRATLEWNWSTREKTIVESLGYGEKAIVTFSELGGNYELAKAYALTGKLYETARHVCELEEKKKEFGKKSLSYLQRALELCRRVSDYHLFSLLNIWLGISTADWAGDLEGSLTFFAEAMKKAIKIRDRYLAGHAAHCLAYVAHWMSMLEQDPDKRKRGFRKAIEYEAEALTNFKASSFVPISFWILPESYSALAKDEVNLKAKRDLLEKAVKVGREGLKYALGSGFFPRPDWGIYHGVSKALNYLSTVKTQINEKKQLCEEALNYREESVRIVEQATPFDHWNKGVFRNYYALVNAELATIETDKLRKQHLLEKAVQSMEKSLESCFKSLKISPNPSLYVTVGNYHENHGDVLDQLYLLTSNPENLRKAIKTYKGAIKAYDKVGWHGHVAQINWRIGTLYDKIGKYLEAAKSFQASSEKYKLAANKIVPLRDFFLSYATYLQSRSIVEKARHSHIREEYSQSKAYYEKASNLCKTLKSWSYLAPNYLAWAHLEHGEDLSRKEMSREALQAFQQAVKLFTEAKEHLEATIPEIESDEEKEKALALGKASKARREYCQGRIHLEEARIHDKESRTLLSAQKYSLATKVFQKVVEALEDETERKELYLTICFCQAWNMMKLAEQKVTPELFSESSKLFLKAKEYSTKEKTSLLAMGNSALCKALEAGTRFEATGDLNLYSIAKRNMESAAYYYLKSGFEKASTWVNANQALLDAYVYMSNAEAETVHEEKTRQYQFAEKYLERSARLFHKAGYMGKRDEVAKILAKVREKHEFVLSLGEVLKPPALTSNTTTFSIPTSVQEEAIGLERFAHANIQARLSAPVEVRLEEDIEVRLDLANVTKELGLLVRIDQLIPESWKVTKIPTPYVVEGKSLNAKGKQLAPQEVESIQFSAQATRIGIFQLCPEVMYVDELGKFKRFKCDAANVTILPPAGFQFKTDNARKVFSYLTKAFVEDYMKRRLTLEQSGWRTFVQIKENAKVPKSSMYGTGKRRGHAISELERRGLVDTRIFLGERGRGGRITKTRVFYEKETIKRHVDQHIMKIKEK